MEHIGYSLINGANVEIKFWGSVPGQCVGLPDRIDLPNGNSVHAASLGPVGAECRLVKRMAAYGTVESVSFDGENIVVTYSVTSDMVVKERERRLTLGFAFDFGDARGVHQIGTTEQDMKGWNEVTMASQAAIALGAPDTIISIVTNTGLVSVSALEWQQILLAAAQFRQPVWAASFALQEMSPIPADFADDHHWQ